MAQVGGISAEEFVGSLSGQDDAHVVLRRSRKQEGGQQGGIGERFGHSWYDGVQRVLQFVFANPDFDVLGSHVATQPTRVYAFVVLGAGE